MVLPGTDQVIVPRRTSAPTRRGLFYAGRQSDLKGLAMMNDDSKVKIRRWLRYIEECRQEAKFLSREGQREMQTVIASYERLIAMAQGEARKRKE